MTTDEERLRQWFIELSGLLDGPLDETTEFDVALYWFGELPPNVFTPLQKLGRDNRSFQEFLDLGQVLLGEVLSEKGYQFGD